MGNNNEIWLFCWNAYFFNRRRLRWWPRTLLPEIDALAGWLRWVSWVQSRRLFGSAGGEIKGDPNEDVWRLCWNAY